MYLLQLILGSSDNDNIELGMYETVSEYKSADEISKCNEILKYYPQQFMDNIGNDSKTKTKEKAVGLKFLWQFFSNINTKISEETIRRFYFRIMIKWTNNVVVVSC